MNNHRVTDADVLAQIPAAREREKLDRTRGRRTKSAKYDRTHKRIVLELTNGIQFAFPVQSIPALSSATASQLSEVDVDPSGSAIRWESLDVDLSVPGLLLSAVGTEEKRQHLASMLGKSSSPAKAEAARVNGLKGGRPKKKNLFLRGAKKGGLRKIVNAKTGVRVASAKGAKKPTIKQ